MMMLTHCTALGSLTTVTLYLVTREDFTVKKFGQCPTQSEKLREGARPLLVDGPLTTDAEHASARPPPPLRARQAPGSPADSDAKLR